MKHEMGLPLGNLFTVLSKPAGREFRILNLTDPQLSDGEWDAQAGEILTRTVNALVERIVPDLITLSGDLAWAENFSSYRRLTALLESFGVPWAPVFGNHDEQGGEEVLTQAAAILREGKHCLLQRGDPALGFGNYTVGIAQQGRLIHGLILMDSHDRREYTDGEGNVALAWADVTPAQIAWYCGQVKALQAAGAGESTLILHIPLYTYRQAAGAAIRQAGGFRPGYGDAFGEMKEEISSYPEDNGFFEVIKACGSTKTVLCGHDHVNSFSVAWQGVRLMYALKTGPGCYWDSRQNGGTLLTIDAAGHLSAEHVYVKV